MQKEKKRVPKLRFEGFEGEWEEKKLGKIAKFSRGKGIAKKDIIEDGKNKCIRYGELYTIYNEVIDLIVSKTDVSLKNSVVSEKNDVIIPSSGETQLDIATASCVLKDGVILGGDLNIIKSKVNGVFLAYLLNNSKKISIAKLAQGNSVVHLYNKELSTLSINFPIPEEQQKIATFLTSIDTRIQQLEKKKTLLEEYKKGVMQKIFKQEIRFKTDSGKEFGEWEEKRLGDVLEIQGGYAFKSNLFNGGNTKVLRIGDINYNIRFDNFTGVYSKEIPDDKYIVKENDFLMALSGATFGKLGKVYGEGIGYINQRVATFRTDNCLEFFYQMMQTNKFKNYINSIPSTSAQPNISNSDIIKYSAKIPCLEEQNKIAHFLSALDRKIAVVDEQIEKTKEWKKGLLQRMFV